MGLCAKGKSLGRPRHLTLSIVFARQKIRMRNDLWTAPEWLRQSELNQGVVLVNPKKAIVLNQPLNGQAQVFRI
jgi:hypothetical protein